MNIPRIQGQIPREGLLLPANIATGTTEGAFQILMMSNLNTHPDLSLEEVGKEGEDKEDGSNDLLAFFSIVQQLQKQLYELFMPNHSTQLQGEPEEQEQLEFVLQVHKQLQQLVQMISKENTKSSVSTAMTDELQQLYTSIIQNIEQLPIKKREALLQFKKWDRLNAIQSNSNHSNTTLPYEKNQDVKSLASIQLHSHASSLTSSSPQIQSIAQSLPQTNLLNNQAPIQYALHIPTQVNDVELEKLAQQLVTIMNQGKMINSTTKTFTLKLFPENLGVIRIQLTEGEHGLVGKLLTQNVKVKELLQSAMPLLHHMIQSTGITIEELKAERDQQPFHQQKEQHSGQQEQDEKRDKKNDKQSFFEWLVNES